MQKGLFDNETLEQITELNNIELTHIEKRITTSAENLDDIADGTDLDKVLKSNKITIEERIQLIERNVLRVLGKFRNSVTCIRTRQDLHDYISAAIKAGRIAIDTETNNSLDPVTCKIAGLCLYYPNGKQAYIPINHRDPNTKMRLIDQCTEQDIREELQRVKDANLPEIYHNGKFDYEVILCTADIKMKPFWDTMTFYRLWDENDLSGLKYLYRTKIDPGQAKYDIEHLFVNISYLDLPPELFALYAATDSYETDELFIWEALQMFDMTSDELHAGGFIDKTRLRDEYKDLFNLFYNVEMPVTTITGDMELTGVAVDQKLGARLKAKYSKDLDKLDAKIAEKFKALSGKILDWRLSKEANEYPKQFEPKKSKKSRAQINVDYPLVDEATGKHYKISKSCLKDQLSDPINLASSTQMAILFYNILGVEPFDKKKPRGTGEEQLEIIKDKLSAKANELRAWLNPAIEQTVEDQKIAEQMAAPYQAASDLCKLILERRGIVKLITTYIDTIPTLVNHWPDGRIRFHMNSLGTDTGRFSSGGKLKFMENEQPIEVSGINIQNIPSGCPSIRTMFTAQTTAKLYEADETDSIVIHEYEEVETEAGWKYPKDLTKDDLVITDVGNRSIKHLSFNTKSRQYKLEF